VPQVSVVIPAYNYGRFVGEAIDSVLAQDYPREAIELIVVDDGSTDDTPDVVRRYGDDVRHVRKENGGVISAVNRGLEEARGELIAMLDADDAWLPHMLSRQVELIDSKPDVGLVYADAEVIDEEGRIVVPSYFNRFRVRPRRGRVLGALMRSNWIGTGSMLFRASLREAYQPMPPEAPWQDWWIAARVASVAELDYRDEVVYRYRLHEENQVLLASGERQVRFLEKSVRFRRWLLEHADPGSVPVSDLLGAYADLLATAEILAERSGRPLEDVLAAGEWEKSRASELAEEAEALAARDDPAALFRLAAALAHDPLWADGRRRLVRLATPAVEAASDQSASLELDRLARAG
jgi:glycosyltransferase involved in cell wall biosynthesis